MAQLEGLAARQPVLMVVEDTHWSDPTTLELLDLTVDRSASLPMLLLVTYRPEFAPPWIGRSHVTMLTLNRLPRRQGAEMIANVTGGKALPKEVAEQIIERTDGVPLFIEELTKTVVESGIVAEAADHYAVVGPMAPLAIPTSLHASLLARLDRLAPTREVAQIGAALGRSFSYELISAVAGIPQQKLDDALDQLATAELIFRRGVPPDAEYTFKHALVQDAAYGTLLRSRRQQLHGRIATTLETHFKEAVAAQPQLIAQHCTEAGLAEKAIRYWLCAGQQAAARSAMREAVTQLQKGLDLLTALPEGSSRLQHELDLRIALGPALIATKGYSSPEVGEAFARASALAEQLDRSEYLFALLYGQWAYHLTRSEHRLALSFAERLEREGEAQTNAVASLQGRYLRGVVHVFRGEFATAIDLIEQCHDLREPAYREASLAISAEDWYSLMLGYSAVALVCLGYFEQAESRALASLSEARNRQHAFSITFCLALMCWFTYVANMPNEAGQYAEQMLDLVNDNGFPEFAPWASVYRGWPSAAVGDAGRGVELLTKALSIRRAAGAMVASATILAMLAEAYAWLGLPAEGLARLDEAAQFMEATDDRK